MATPDVILLIRLEHRNLAKLLDILDGQLNQLAREGRLDYGLVESALAYFQSYPDECHHPKEDLIFRKLEARNPAAVEGLHDLIGEHDELARLTRQSAELVHEARGGMTLPVGSLEKQLRRFIDVYRDHMAREEERFLRVAERSLTRHDWNEIEFHLFDRTDPLLDEEVEQRFQGLRDEIRAMERRQGEDA